MKGDPGYGRDKKLVSYKTVRVGICYICISVHLANRTIRVVYTGGLISITKSSRPDYRPPPPDPSSRMAQ